MLRGGGGEGDTYQLAINLQIPKAQKGLNVRILKRNKPEPFTPSRLMVQHNRRINHLSRVGVLVSGWLFSGRSKN